jgi:hypothetical protein
MDKLILDTEDAEEELASLFRIQAISSEEAEVSHQERTVSGAEEEKNESSDGKTSQEPIKELESNFNKEAAAYTNPSGYDETAAELERVYHETVDKLDREQPYNAYGKEE